MYQRVIVVVEDEDLIRSLIADSLERAGFRVASAANAADARRIIKSVDPDAVILDIDLGQGPSGFDIAEVLRREAQGVGIVFLTSLPDSRFAGQDAGMVHEGEAYLNKSLISESQILIDALEAVLQETITENYRHDRLEARPFAHLSKTQIIVLRLLSEGKTNQQIADLRKRSLGATEGTIARTLEALGITSELDINGRVLAVQKYLTVVKAGKKYSK